MHGNVNEICARLLDSFEPQQRISLLIWTAEDVHDCTSDMNLTDDEAEAVLAEIAECSSHSRYQHICDMLITQQEKLKLYADQHAEAGLIYRAID
uniref:DUF1380 domain-containing protein n=1 Tax=Klebsiella aerogenes TaxID=548 RepID=A0A2Z5WQZ1_KLEAE|nr:antirestriction protein [Klebsiella aerogenes]BBC21702.1 hypothetical protein [Klebsiella aerogenes]